MNTVPKFQFSVSLISDHQYRYRPWKKPYQSPTVRKYNTCLHNVGKWKYKVSENGNTHVKSTRVNVLYHVQSLPAWLQNTGLT